MSLSSNSLTFCITPNSIKRPRSALTTPLCSASPPNDSNSYRSTYHSPAFNPYHNTNEDKLTNNNSQQSSSLDENQKLSQKVEDYLLAEEQVSDLISSQQVSPQPLPVMLDILNYRGRVAARNKKTRQRAIQLFERCIEINSADGRAWLGLARIKISEADTVTARKLFHNGINASPRNPHLLQAWGVLEERLGQYQRAKGLYKAAVRADSSHCASWVALGLWYQKIDRNITAARDAFRTGSEADPNNYYIWHVWGELERTCGRIKIARECFRKGVEANSRNAATYVAWGNLEDNIGNYTEANRLFSRAHTVNPKNIHAFVAHAVTSEKVGHIGKAKKLLHSAISIAPFDPAPLQALGELERRNGDLIAARNYYQKAISVNKKHAPSWHAWACAELEAGNISRARELFQEAIWAAPRSNHVVKTWHAWATLEMLQKDYSTARRYFAHGLHADSKSIPLLTGLAKLEARDQNIARARDCMKIALKLEPKRKSLWRLFENLERTYGNPERAEILYERSIVLSRQIDERLIVSDALPGDFQAGGMWIDASELSAPTAIEAIKQSETKKTAISRTVVTSHIPKPQPKDPRKISESTPMNSSRSSSDKYDGRTWWILKGSKQRSVFKSIHDDTSKTDPGPSQPGSLGLSPTS